MSSKKVGVFGIFSTRIAVDNAMDSLVRAGFPTSDISVLLPESLGGTRNMGTEKETKAPEGTAVGVTAGGVIGGTLGLLAGVGLLAIPGLGPFIAAGPIMAGLAGLGVGEAVGGVTGALIGMGIPEFRSQEIRRSPAEGRNSALCALRHGRGNQACQGSSQIGWRRRRFLHRRIFCRYKEDRSRLRRYDCALNS